MYSVGGSEPTERSEKSDKRLIKGILTHYIKQFVQEERAGDRMQEEDVGCCMGGKDQEVKNEKF